MAVTDTTERGLEAPIVAALTGPAGATAAGDGPQPSGRFRLVAHGSRAGLPPVVKGQAEGRWRQ